MSKLSVRNIQLFLFILALITASIACQTPFGTEQAYTGLWDDCETVNRSEYEAYAAQFGQDLETPKYPESAVYEVCYTDSGDGRTESSVRMSEGYRQEPDDLAGGEEPAPPPASEAAPPASEDEGIAGIYVGVPAIPSKLQAAQQDYVSFSIDENAVAIIVDEDGTTTGDKILVYRYVASGIDDALVNVTSEWKITFEGILGDTQGELKGILTYHFVSTGPGTDNPQDYTTTREFSYDIDISGNIMRGSLKGADNEIDDEDLDMFSFEATKQ